MVALTPLSTAHRKHQSGKVDGKLPERSISPLGGNLAETPSSEEPVPKSIDIPPTHFERFDITERLVHWVTAALMLTCIATALPLYFPAVTAVIGRRVLVLDVHVYSGLCLPLPLLVGVARSDWGRRLRSDLSRLNRWTRDDIAWLRSWGRDPWLKPGKFNGGQKTNAAFMGGAIVVMATTGTVMKWFEPFPLSWRTGATFVHDVVAYAIVVVLAGHIGYAIYHRATLRAMTTGLISYEWAARHTPGWVDEMSAMWPGEPPGSSEHPEGFRPQPGRKP
jgi:formate dehydrogenase subunit gamma